MVGEALAVERDHLLAKPDEPFDVADELYCRVDGKGCVQVKTNWYSTPLRPGTQARVRVWPNHVEIHHDGRCVARHPRWYGRRRQVLDLEHYLDVLHRKPGAFAGSRPLDQWRAEGRWTTAHDWFWEALRQRHGTQAGTRLMIEVLQAGRRHGFDKLTRTIREAAEHGVTDAEAIRYLVESDDPPTPPTLAVDQVARRDFFSRPLPELGGYDRLLGEVTA